MQTSFDIDALITRVASAPLKGHKLARISSEPSVDMDGVDAIRVTIVLSEGDDTIAGDAALDTIVDVHQALQREGEHRRPFFTFTNEDELASDVDPEPGASD